MTIAVNATLRMVAQFKIAAASKAQNVYHFQHLSVEDKTDEQVLLCMEEYIVAAMTHLSARMHSAFSLHKIEAFVRELGAWEPIGVGTPTWAGSNVNDRVPSGIALLVSAFKERTGYSDKKFLAGFTEEDMDGDYFNAAALAAAENYAAAWIAQFTGTDAVVLLPVSYRALTSAIRTYTSYAVSSVASYQRRRKPGVGLT